MQLLEQYRSEQNTAEDRPSSMDWILNDVCVFLLLIKPLNILFYASGTFLSLLKSTVKRHRTLTVWLF